MNFNNRNDEFLNVADENLDELKFVLNSPLSSSHSIRTSLEAIMQHKAGLSKKREGLLNRVPNPNEYVSLSLNSVEIQDLAYLSAATGDEFALFRGKNEDILFHGNKGRCEVENASNAGAEHQYSDTLLDALKSKKLLLVAHSHPDRSKIIPSDEDRQFLMKIKQERSIIVSWYTGIEQEFYANRFRQE